MIRKLLRDLDTFTHTIKKDISKLQKRTGNEQEHLYEEKPTNYIQIVSLSMHNRTQPFN